MVVWISIVDPWITGRFEERDLDFLVGVQVDASWRRESKMTRVDTITIMLRQELFPREKQGRQSLRFPWRLR
jgi:hypothetical protein